jgi:hypothetical protein
MRNEMSSLEYLKQVYGLEELILPAEQVGVDREDIAVADSFNKIYADQASVVFWSSLERKDFEDHYRLLFEKIVTAMGLSFEQISLILSATPPSFSSETKVLILMDSDAGELGWRSDNSQLTIHSLPVLAKDAEAKKITWYLLKEVKNKVL